jgi:hypothetical protein
LKAPRPIPVDENSSTDSITYTSIKRAAPYDPLATASFTAYSLPGTDIPASWKTTSKSNAHESLPLSIFEHFGLSRSNSAVSTIPSPNRASFAPPIKKDTKEKDQSRIPSAMLSVGRNRVSTSDQRHFSSAASDLPPLPPIPNAAIQLQTLPPSPRADYPVPPSPRSMYSATSSMRSSYRPPPGFMLVPIPGDSGEPQSPTWSFAETIESLPAPIHERPSSLRSSSQPIPGTQLPSLKQTNRKSNLRSFTTPEVYNSTSGAVSHISLQSTGAGEALITPTPPTVSTQNLLLRRSPPPSLQIGYASPLGSLALGKITALPSLPVPDIPASPIEFGMVPRHQSTRHDPTQLRKSEIPHHPSAFDYAEQPHPMYSYYRGSTASSAMPANTSKPPMLPPLPTVPPVDLNRRSAVQSFARTRSELGYTEDSEGEMSSRASKRLTRYGHASFRQTSGAPMGGYGSNVI